MAVPDESAVGGQIARLERTRLATASSLVEREALLVVALAVYAAGLVWHIPKGFRQDAWMTLLGGREIVQHGLPRHDELTVWAHGADWIDQQWLAQLLFYGSHALGGLLLTAIVPTLATFVAVLGAVVLARRLDATQQGVLWCAVPASFVLVTTSWQLRAQSFAYPLFALLLALLVADSRRPSARVLLALLIVALWANLHGSAVLAAALVAVRGATLVLDGPRRPNARAAARATALVVGAPLSLLVSPYGFGLVDYYRDTILSTRFHSVVSEWRPVHLGLATLPFFALLFAALWLVGRQPRRFTSFDVLALVLLAVAGLAAVRNLPWFALTSLALLPRAIDDVLVAAAPARRNHRLNVAIVASAIGLSALVTAAGLSRAEGAIQDRYSDRAAEVAAAADGASRGIFADETYADWLLWRSPDLRGRLAFDIRFELLSSSQLDSLSRFRNGREGWASVVGGYRLLVLDRQLDARAIAYFLRLDGSSAIYDDGRLVVISRAS